METESIPLGTAPPLAPHPPADMLNLFMTRYDYDYNRDPAKVLSGSGTGNNDGDNGDGVSGAVRNRPIHLHDASGEMDGDTTYRVDYVDHALAADMRTLVEAAYGSTSAAVTGGACGVPFKGQGVYTREWFTLPGRTHMTPSVESIYKTDYTADAVDRARAAAPPTSAKGSDGAKGGSLYAGAPGALYKADFLTVKDAREDDGTDIPPKITSDESLRPRHQRLSSCGDVGTDGKPTPSAAAAARYLMTSASPPWMPGRLGGNAPGPSGASPANFSSPASASFPLPTGTAAASIDFDGRSNNRSTHPAYGPYSCESWLYGDTSLAHPDQIPQDFAGSAQEDLLGSVTRVPANLTASGVDVDGCDPAALLRRLAGRNSRSGPGKRQPLSLFSGRRGAGGALQDDETNPIYITPAEQRRCASRHRLEDEGYVKGMSMYHSDFVDRTRLPELPGNHRGDADPRATNTNAHCTAGEMFMGELTANTRAVANMRNAHGTLLTNQRIAERTATMAGGSVRALATVASALPPPVVVDVLRHAERREAVDRADPHRRKLRFVEGSHDCAKVGQ